MHDVTPIAISTMSTYFLGGQLKSVYNQPSLGSSTWPSANRAVFIPFALPWEYLIKRFIVAKGASGSSINASVGIYDMAGASIYTSGTLTGINGGTSVTYHTASSPVFLTPGKYYLALAISATSSAGQGASLLGGAGIDTNGLKEQSSALPLPATATMIDYTSALFPFAGFTRA